MKYLAIAIVLLIPASGWATALTCTVPDGAATTRAAALCTLLRKEMRVTSANWSNDKCATEFLRRSLRNYEAAVTDAASRQTVKDDTATALATFDGVHADATTRSVCGDSTVDDTDPDLGEECDPPNGTTCDTDCQTIP